MTGETPDTDEYEQTEEVGAAVSSITLQGATPKTATGTVVRSDDVEGGEADE